MNINKTILAGRLGKDPELKVTPQGMQICSFSIATNRVWKNKEGQKQESTDWHNVVFFGRRAEVIAERFKKGKEIYVEGRLQTRSWEKDGHTNYKTEIVGDDFQFVGWDNNNAGGGGQAQAQPAQGVETIEYPEEEINPDDIPF